MSLHTTTEFLAADAAVRRTPTQAPRRSTQIMADVRRARRAADQMPSVERPAEGGRLWRLVRRLGR